MTTVNHFDERRKKDRSTMATLIAGLVEEQGATFSWVEPEDGLGPNEVSMNVTAPGGLKVKVEFDGNSPMPNTYVLSWFMASESPNRLNGEVFGGNVNTCHFRKATYVANGFKDLYAQLAFGLGLAKSGMAYVGTNEKLAA